jgi:hypothetical protein
MSRLGRLLFAIAICSAFLTFTAIDLRAQDQSPSEQAGHISNTLRSQNYPEIFYPNGIIPDWDRGYMIHHEIEAYSSPDQPMVTMYDETGKRVREARIWPQGAGSVRIRRTAATHDGAILAGGWAIMQDGSISGYIAKTDLSGNTVQSIATGAFNPEQLCEASDGTVWSLGKAGRPDGLPVPDTQVVRHYRFERGLLHSFLPEVTVRAVMNSTKPWFVPFGSFLRCGKDNVSVYLEFTDEYVEINSSSFELKRWKLDEATVQQGKASGLAITDDGRVYASFSSEGMVGPSGLTGLYQVKAESGNPVARLIPVVGTINYFERGKPKLAGTFLLLLGADGNQLVVRRIEDTEFPVSWVDILQIDLTD